MLAGAHRHAQPALRRVLLPAVLPRLGHEAVRSPVPALRLAVLRLAVLLTLAVTLAVLLALAMLTPAVLAPAVRMPAALGLGTRRGSVCRGG